jgi:hypothetical protein
MGRSGALGLVIVAATAMTFAAACSKADQQFMESRALADCGQAIGNGSIESVLNFTPGGVAEPNAVIELVANCDVGVQVAISGPNFKLEGGINTKDGAYQAVVTSFSGTTDQNGTLTVSQHGRRLGQMTLLSRWAPPSSGQPNFCDPLSPNNYGSLPKNYCPPGWRMG